MTEISRRKTEMSRVEGIRLEMASGVRVLGAEGRTAAEQNHQAARLTGLPISVVERLRWKKLKRIPADVADAIRDALADCTAREEARARHEQDILRQRLQSLAALADGPTDPDFYRGQVAGVVEQARRFGLLDRSEPE